MQKQILNFCLEKGMLVDNDLLDLFSETSDIDSVKLIIEKVKSYTGSRVLNKDLLEKNKDKVNQFFLGLPESKKKNLETLRIKLGLSIEISREPVFEKIEEEVEESNVKILTQMPRVTKTVEVKDFVTHFKKRFNVMKNILQEHAELDNLVSIDKISNNRQGVSIIGIVSDKKVTKNKNIILEVEDNTGKIKVLINKDKEDLIAEAENIPLDAVLGFKGAGSREIFFVNDIVFPEARLPGRKKAEVEEYALFIGDLHYGSKLFLKKGFTKFLDYLKGNVPDTPEVKKIKYLFLVGDIITGVGNYPNQEHDLHVMDLESQYQGLADLLKQIPRHIKIIISPGNHDGVRIMEPQPLFDEKYAWPLYEMDNVIITENPSTVNIASRVGFSGFNVLTYHGFSYFHYARDIPDLITKDSTNCPEEIMKFLLRHRHLAPTHASTQYYPFEQDQLVIKEVPDFLVSAHTHKCAITYYNNIMVISTACWEAMTPYQEKFGNIPDHCKVPMVNLKTRAVKLLDFEVPDEKGEGFDD